MIDLSSITSLATYGSEVFPSNGGDYDGTYMFGKSIASPYFFRWLMDSPYTAVDAQTADFNNVIGISAPAGSSIYIAELDYVGGNNGIQVNRYDKSTLSRTATGTFYTFGQAINFTPYGGAISDDGGYTAVAFASVSDGVGRLEVYQESSLTRAFTLSLSGAYGNVSQAMPICITSDGSYVYSVAVDITFQSWLTKRSWSDLTTVVDSVWLGASSAYLGSSILSRGPESGLFEVYIGFAVFFGTSQIEGRSTADLSLQTTSVNIAGDAVTDSAWFGPMAFSAGGTELFIVASDVTSSNAELFQLPGGSPPLQAQGTIIW